MESHFYSDYDNGIITVFEDGKIKWIYPEIKENKVDFTSINTDRFALRDIIILQTIGKYVPYDKCVIGLDNSKYRGDYTNSVLKSVKNKFLKALLLDEMPSVIKFDFEGKPHPLGWGGSHKTKLRVKYYGLGGYTISIPKNIIMGQVGIKLAEHFELSGLHYEEQVVIKVPEKPEELFLPSKEKVDFGVYLKHNKLLLPAIMVKGKKTFTSTPLICGATLVGVLNRILPVEIDMKTKRSLIINYGNQVVVRITPLFFRKNVVTIKIKTNKPILFNPDSSIGVDGSRIEVELDDESMNKLLDIIKEKAKSS